MQKLITFSLALALSGAYAYADSHVRGGVNASMDDSARAVDDAEMDVAMMEDVPEVMDAEMPSAPSVALSGSAKMGLKRVDDKSKADDGDVETVVEYEVKFSSAGVTDGGLVFGAAITIDEEGKGAADKNGVNAASAYIGSADGSWKLQFGSNDPGIDLVGNVGLADADEISGKTKTVLPLMYTDKVDNEAMKRVMFTAKYDARAAGQTGITAIGTIGQVASDALDANGVFLSAWDKPISYIKQKDDAEALMYTFERQSGTSLTYTVGGADMPVPPPGRSVVALTGSIASMSYALTTGEDGGDAWSVGAKYDAGAISVGLGMDSNDVMALNVGGTFADNTVSATYVKQDGEKYYAYVNALRGVQIRVGDTPGEAGTLQSYPGGVNVARERTVNEMEAMGLSFSRTISLDSSVTVTYSKLTDKGVQGTFVGTKQWEIDFSYDLGGGASFYAGIEQADKSEFEGTYNVTVAGTVPTVVVSPTPYTTATYSPIVKKSKTTTLEAGITMTF